MTCAIGDLDGVLDLVQLVQTGAAGECECLSTMDGT